MLSYTPVIKQPAEVKLQRFEFGQPGGVAISSIVTAGITAAGRVPEAAALVIASQIVGSTYAQLRLEGGTSGELYHIEVLVEDASGDRYEADAEILVLDLGFRAAGAQVSTYLTLEQFIARTGIDEAIRLSDEAGAGVIGAALLDAALIDAQALVDSYLGSRFAVPLIAPIPAPIPTITFDLALARLYRGDLPAGVETKRDEALRLLRDIAAGRAAIPVAPAPTIASPAPVVVQPHDRLFTRKRMNGF